MEKEVREMELETVVVGLDLSPPSLVAARWVATHFAPNARLVLVYSADERWLPRFLTEHDQYEHLKVSSREQARLALEEFADTFEGQQRPQTIVQEGQPASGLVDVATREAADLVVVGAHRRRPVMGSVLGSTASKLLGESRIPVLVAHGLTSGEPRRILAAIDESPVRTKVLRWAAGLADTFDATGSVLYAIEPPGVGVTSTLLASADEYAKKRAHILKLAEEWLQQVIEEEQLDTERFTGNVAYGRPELEIVSAADRLEPDMIVMGTRRRGLALAYTIGSVARGVIEASACPVLVVPPDRS